jgi:hypothetical protein
MVRIITSLIVVVLAAGCASRQPAREETPAAKAPAEKSPAAKAPLIAKAPPAEKAPLVAKAPPAEKAPLVAKAPPPAKAPATRAPAASPPPEKVAGPPPLDLKSLEQQLKETRAIGVMTKLSIKNQVDDLVDQFRAYYQGTVKVSLEELRRKYDLLVMKVLALLQDGDQQLAKAVASSREAIWGILADRDRFAKL